MKSKCSYTSSDLALAQTLTPTYTIKMVTCKPQQVIIIKSSEHRRWPGFVLTFIMGSWVFIQYYQRNNMIKLRVLFLFFICRFGLCAADRFSPI